MALVKARKGYTLVEVLVAMGVTLTLFGSTLAVFLTVKSVNTMARHKIQAVQVVRGQVENLKAGAFTAIADGTLAASYDVGPDGVFGNADDMRGTLTTSVRDWMDFDGDGDSTETQINVDNTGGNDTNALPVRVSFDWNEYVIGRTRSMNVSVDTIIAQ